MLFRSYNTSDGRARFINVPVGTHTVTEDIPATWTLLSVTPIGGIVNVTAGPACVGVVFKNRQILPVFTAVERSQNASGISIQPLSTPTAPDPVVPAPAAVSTPPAPREEIAVPYVQPKPGRNLDFWQMFYGR